MEELLFLIFAYLFTWFHLMLCTINAAHKLDILDLQEAEAFALYHKALDLQKHDKFEESAKAYHELLKTPLLKEVWHAITRLTWDGWG